MPTIIRRKYIICLVSAILLLFGCSPQKNTRGSRAYHELTTRYNVYFNAQTAYEDAVDALFENHKENYSELLPIYPNSTVPGDTAMKQPGEPFDRVIEKTTKAIQEHSIAAKPMRDPAQMKKQEYRDWLRQSEFNPFIDQAWLLMGKAHIQNKDYAQALAVLSQTARLFSHDIYTVSEAQLWMLRAYTEMGWFTDAETVASTLKSRKLPRDLQRLFNEFFTFYLLRRNNTEEAIPFLTETIRGEKNRLQKQRLQFLLGQLYAQTGAENSAYTAFEKLKGIAVPHEIELNAILAQAQVSGDTQKTIVELTKMAKRAKNANHADQIHYTIGNVFFAQENIEKAIESFYTAETKSIQNSIYKAYAQVAQGDIYYQKRDFVKSQHKYADAVGSFPESSPHYPEVKFRVDVLGEIAPYMQQLNEQDSLQHLANLPESERLTIINNHIARLKKSARADKREQQLELFLSQNQPLEQSPSTVAVPQADAAFYFYNPQWVAQGRNEFRRIWGTRKLEDNWRLSDKTSINFADDLDSESESTGQLRENPSDDEQENDIYSPDYYLRQLPVTEEDFQKSNAIIGEALYHIGLIAQNRLLDLDYAAESYSRYLQDFPEGTYRAEIYNQLHLLHLRNNDFTLASHFKNRILDEYPDSKFAAKMADPDYEAVVNNYVEMLDLLYQDTYAAYRNGDPALVQRNYEKAVTFFDSSDYMPQFKLLHALSYAQTADSVQLKIHLEEISTQYAETLQGELAQNMLSGLAEGKILAAAASAISDFDWNIVDYSVEATDSLTFDAAAEQAYSYFLLFDERKTNKNDLLFAVSDYNFSNFQTRSFPVSFVRFSVWDAMKIDGFNHLDEVRRYASLIEADTLFAQSLNDSIRTLFAAQSNFEMLNSGKSVEEYLVFYNSELNRQTAVIHKIDDVAEQESAQEPEEIEKPDEVIPELKTISVTPDLPTQIHQPEQKTWEERQTELERKEAEALSRTANVPSEKEKREALKAREKARKALIKERARLLKQKEKERKAELKQRERERKQKLKEQERLRKEKLKERNRVLRKQNR